MYCLPEAMDERLQEVQGIGDKVDMLEASVRSLENNALGSPWSMEQPPMDSPANMSLSSSSLHSVHTVTSVASNSRNPPRRNHTIGNIKYDCAAYKVSFNLEDDKKSDSEDEPINFESDQDASSRISSKRKRTISASSCKPTNKQTMDAIDEAVTTSTATSSTYVVPTIVRSKSFSNNFEYAKNKDSVIRINDRVEKTDRNALHHGSQQVFVPTQSSPNRSRSLRIQPPPGLSNSNRATRLSWTHQDLPDQPSSLKDTKLRGSYTSLVSLDLGSGATTPTPSSLKGAAFDISARELMQRPSVHHSGNLEMKKTSGFKSYKRYWAVLDSNFLYLYGKEKDPKAKQIIDVTASIIVELANNELGTSNNSSANGSNSSNLSSGSFRESLKKRGGRSFEMIFNNGENRCLAASTKDEAEEWMKKLKESSETPLYDDHQELVAVEMAYEEEVVHEVASSGEVQQEWRLAVKPHSRNPSRYSSCKLVSPYIPT